MRDSWRFRLKLFGHAGVMVEGRPVNLGSNKAMAILAYLALRKTPVLRSTLAALLWPESDWYRARRSLREELSLLRRLVPAETLVVQDQSVALDHTASVDVWNFTQAIAEGAYERATMLYAGELLEGVYVRNAGGFETWLEGERDHLRNQYVEALLVLCEKSVQAGDLGAALAYNQQIIAANPYLEGPYLRSMQWASQIGETAVALDVYHQLQSVMKREFGIPPSPAAVSLAKAIAAQGIWPLAATAHENASAVPAGAQRHLGPDAGERGPRAAGRKP